MGSRNKLRIVVTGGADAPREALDLAFAVGYQVVRRGHFLLNGGAKGVDRSAVHGGDKYRKEVGSNFDGQIIAYRPGNAPQPASSRYTDVKVVDDTHAERRDVVVRNGDILIVLSGAGGTLDIAKRAHNYGKPVIPIGCSKGAALELWHKLVEDDGKTYSYRKQLTIEMFQSLNPLDYKVDDVACLAVDITEKIMGLGIQPIPNTKEPPLSVPPEKELQVFLCYAHDDAREVRKLYDHLKQNGIVTWLDQENLIPGQDWKWEISKAVKQSDVVIICLSSNSISKEGFVQKEITYALDAADEKPDGTIFLIPARLDACTVPTRLNRWQWVDLFQSDGYAKLMKALRIRAQQIGAVL